MNRTGKQTGYILLPVIVVITLVAAIALLMNTESALESNTTGSELDAQQARYVVEAGLNHALWMNRQQGCGPYGNLTDEPLDNDKYTTVLTTDLGSTTAVTISVDQDSWIRNDDPSKEHSIDVKLHVRLESGNVERPLYRFDLSAVPAKSSILSATAWFYVVKGHAEGPVDIHRVLADWTEAGATWDSMGGMIEAAPLTSIPAQVAGAWVSANLTGQVQAWINGQDNFGIALNSTNEGTHAEFASRESGTKPYLEIIVGTPPSPRAQLKALATLKNGITRTIFRDDVTLYQQPGTMLQYQPDAAEAVDSYIWAANKNTNYGTDDETWIATGATNAALALFKFDLDRVPAGARIDGAWLSVYHRDGNDVDVPVSAHRITSAWVEDEVTWNDRDSTNTWDNPGGDYDAGTVSTTLVGKTGPGAGPQRYEWDITSLVRGWVNGSYSNHGVVLRTEEPGTFGERFDTSDHADPGRHPRLNISYSCPCGEVCMTPRGAGRIALIGDDSSPDPYDQLKIEIIESWGYEVDFYQDGNSSGINWSNYDLAYVSETVISGDVSANLANLSIGVVNEEPKLYDDLRLAGGDTEHVGSSIDIVDNSHFISSIFPLGPLSIYHADMEILTADPALAVGLQTLGEYGGEVSLTATDKGAQTISGTAAGRRVTLPLGQHFASGFNWTQLNNNGRLIVQRAIEWGIGGDIVSIGNLLMVVRVDPASLTGQELARKATFESWGYAVTPIAATESQANFDAAVATADVAYISEEVVSSDVNTKLKNAAIGVVNEDRALSDEFGFSATNGTYTSSSIDITDNSHYITTPFSIGSLAVAAPAQALAVATGSMGPGVQVLGEQPSSSNATLLILDLGAGLEGGGTAAGRRAHLPWGGGSFDFNTLNADGLTITLRALEWAGGAELDLTPWAHWKLDETSGATAVDSVGGHDGTLQNSPVWRSGLLQGALEFDGVDDYVDLTSDAELDDIFDGGATAMAWINPAGWGENGYGRIFDKSSSPSSTGDGWVIRMNVDNGGVINFGHGFTGGRGWWRIPNASISLGNWQHIAIAYDSSSAGNDPAIYINGNPVTVIETDSPSGNYRSDAAINLRLGNYAGGTTHTFDGVIDDARIYDRRLSAAEIAEIATLPGPLAHWKLDETTGPTAVDSEGGHDGTWTNGPTPTSGVLDGGLEFDGGNDYVNVPHDNNLSLTTFSISAWIRPSALSGWQVMVNKGASGNEVNYYLGTNGDEVSLGYYNTGWVEFSTASADLVTDQWYHVVATYDDIIREGRIYLNGSLVHTSTASKSPLVNGDDLTLGRSEFGEYWSGLLDDVRIYDRVLGDSEVTDLFDEGGLSGPTAYNETYQPWSATNADTWQTVDLSGYGVPAGAVVEVAITNSRTGAERWGGVRAVGSTLDRRFRLHEAEGDGVDTVTLHVQADASSQIQHYSDNTADVSFILLGYWVGANYVELFDDFSADDSGIWSVYDFGDNGASANQVVEVVMQNTDGSAERLAGVRATDSSQQRRFDLHEPEAGGVEALSMMVVTDSNAEAEVFAEDKSDIDFHVVGYWSTPPGTYTEHGGAHGQVSTLMNWETVDLTSFGVPADSVAQFVLANENAGTENAMLVRAVGSTINNRGLDLHEAESGGSDLGTIHANVDTSSRVQWAAEQGATGGRFYPVGWWVLSP